MQMGVFHGLGGRRNEQLSNVYESPLGLMKILLTR